MYKFRDVTETSEVNSLPAEALKINGEYLENQVDGYRTLYVSGRELLAPALTTAEISRRDGVLYRSRRYPERVITVGFQLVTASNAAFRAAFNKLSSLLNVEEAELIFADEPDKFFCGTPSGISDIEPGRNAVTGEIEFTCSDPFKYSVTEYEVEPTADSGATFVIQYNGTAPAYPTLEADFYNEEETSADGESQKALTGKGDCGFVAFVDANENIIQLGDPEESDGADFAKSQTLVSQYFEHSTSWGTAVRANWAVNAGVVSSSAAVQTGTPALKHGYNTTAEGTYYMTASGYGSGSNWHGPSITRTIPADADGEVGATNWKLHYAQKFSIGNGTSDNKQQGLFQMAVSDGSKIIAGVSIWKSTTGTKGTVRLYVNGQVMETLTGVDLSFHNLNWGNNRTANAAKGITAITTNKRTDIVKSGDTITFTVGNIKRSYKNSAYTDLVATKLTFGFYQAKNVTPMAYNGLYGVIFTKNYSVWQDVPNKFSTGDVVVADCSNGEIYLRDDLKDLDGEAGAKGVLAPELGAPGNDWEKFCLSPGTNQITTAYSDWVEAAYQPTFKLRYREVFL